LYPAAALTIFGVAMCSTILRWLGTAESVMPQSTSYLSFYFAGVLANVMYNIFNGILDALGDARHPLYYLIFSSCLNIVLDLLFVGVFGWGVWSAAVATVISQLASALLCLRHLMQKGAVYEVTLPGRAFSQRHAAPDHKIRPAHRRAVLRHRLRKRSGAGQHQLLRSRRHGRLRVVL
jgi:Na+-driven multidrug efflux pump